MKNRKRILDVTIKQMYDESPDTSWLGVYSDRPNTEFAIDRALDASFQGDVDASTEKLDRIESFLESDRPICDEHETSYDCECAVCQEEKYYTRAIDTIQLARQEFNADWNNREYRYFNPGSIESFDANATWIPADVTDKQAYWLNAMRNNARQDFDRMEKLNNGGFCFIGIRADARVAITDKRSIGLQSYHLVQELTSGGLWGIESDSDDAFMKETEQEQLDELKEQLKSFGFSSRAISTAFKNVEHKSV